MFLVGLEVSLRLDLSDPRFYYYTSLVCWADSGAIFSKLVKPVSKGPFAWLLFY